jgi:hypothetical protein
VSATRDLSGPTDCGDAVVSLLAKDRRRHRPKIPLTLASQRDCGRRPLSSQTAAMDDKVLVRPTTRQTVLPPASGGHDNPIGAVPCFGGTPPPRPLDTRPSATEACRVHPSQRTTLIDHAPAKGVRNDAPHLARLDHSRELISPRDGPPRRGRSAVAIQRIPGFLSIGRWSAPAYAGSCESAA